jgi:hypothetical protein
VLSAISAIGRSDEKDRDSRGGERRGSIRGSIISAPTQISPVTGSAFLMPPTAHYQYPQSGYQFPSRDPAPSSSPTRGSPNLNLNEKAQEKQQQEGNANTNMNEKSGSPPTQAQARAQSAHHQHHHHHQRSQSTDHSQHHHYPESFRKQFRTVLAVPAFSVPLTKVLSPVVVRGQWEIVMRSVVYAFVLTWVVLGSLLAVPEQGR